MKSMHLLPLTHRNTGEKITRTCQIQRFNGGELVDERELWFEFDSIAEIPKDEDCESYLLSMVMDAMAEGRDVIVHGSVSRELLSNLVEYQSAWNSWLPETYARVELAADELVEEQNPVPGAVCAFSGGVDASFSVWRNSQNKNSHRSQHINLCSMVHGFDIALGDQASFGNAFSRAADALKALGIPIAPIATNYREISTTSWAYSHGAAVVGALSNFKGLAGTCLVGSTRPYDSLVVPCGSSPVIDHLLSSIDFKVIHDGASHSRTQKVAEIIEWKDGCDNLRVCWVGDRQGGNCGTCEKCLRTKLNFLANNLSVPACLPGQNITRRDVRKAKLTSEPVRVEWRQILKTAGRNDVRADWVKGLSKKMRRRAIQDFFLPEGSKRKRVAIRTRARLKGLV